MNETHPTLYLETSIPSYLTARPSRDLVTAAHQQITQEWWERRSPYYRLFVSEVVLQEAAAGDPDAASRRLNAIRPFPVLRISEQVTVLAGAYLKALPIPAAAVADAFHLALASAYDMAFLVTWNCRHIARGDVMQALPGVNKAFGLGAPVICTPEELLYGNNELD